MVALLYPFLIGSLLLPTIVWAEPENALTLSINHDDGGRTSQRHLKTLLNALRENNCRVVAFSADASTSADLVFDSQPPEEARNEREGYQFIAQSLTPEGKSVVRGAVVVKASTGIANLKSLQGERIAFVSENSWAGYRLPQQMLQEAGITPERDTVFFVSSHDGAVAMMLHGDVFAAAVAEPLATRWAKANDFSIIQASEPVATGGWWLREGVSDDVGKRCANAFGLLSKGDMKALPGWIAGFEVVGR